jgi:hypothetical protein
VIRDAGEIEATFKAAARARAGGLLVLPIGLLDPHARRIAELAAKSRLPAMYGLRFYVEAGGLVSYSADVIEIWRRAAVFVDKILKGAKPADLPVEQPTKFDLAINLKNRQGPRPHHPAGGAGPGGRDHPVVLNGPELPRWFIIVRREKPWLFEHLRESYVGDARVEVIVDRRLTISAEMPAEANLRRRERRIGDRRAAAQGDRRQAERRQPLAPAQHAFWVTEGFFMVRPASEAPRVC